MNFLPARAMAILVIATAACELPVNGTGPDDPKPVVQPTDAGSPDAMSFNSPNGDIPLNLTACGDPPGPGYARTVPAQCVSQLSYWASVNVVYFTADGTCELSAVDPCACDYTCACVTHAMLGLEQCTCSQATPDSVLILNCPTL